MAAEMTNKLNMQYIGLLLSKKIFMVMVYSSCAYYVYDWERDWEQLDCRYLKCCPEFLLVIMIWQICSMFILDVRNASVDIGNEKPYTQTNVMS